MTPDWLLLRRFVQEDSQEAFAALTARYIDLVYSVCLREVHDPELAQDVTQAVFLLLARTAPRIRSRTALPSWLFRAARFASQNARTREQRRRRHEEKVAQMMQSDAETNDTLWDEVEPLLNQSLTALSQTDQDCVLLRFFQGMSFAEAGTALGLSEDAARKRVTRALEKMRRFFVQNGVIVPSTALAVLLTAHAAKAAPAACQASIAQLTTAALTGSHVYSLSKGILKAMKIVQIKSTVGLAVAVVVVGTVATYGVVRSAAVAKFTADSTPSQYRTVALTGRVRRADGTPVGRAHVCARVQTAEWIKLFNGESRLATPGEQEISVSLSHTKPDGTYTLYVDDGIKYNVFLAPEDVTKTTVPDTGFVAATAEGVSGAKGATVSVPDLVLTPGGIVTGLVTDKATGRPIAGATVMGYGAQSPQSTRGTTVTQTDSTGTYRLRVAPGKSRVYISDMLNTQPGSGDGHYLEVAEGETKTQDFQVTLK